jgi:hypothetical protein
MTWHAARVAQCIDLVLRTCSSVTPSHILACHLVVRCRHMHLQVYTSRPICRSLFLDILITCCCYKVCRDFSAMDYFLALCRQVSRCGGVVSACHSKSMSHVHLFFHIPCLTTCFIELDCRPSNEPPIDSILAGDLQFHLRCR